ncbi:MAG: 1,4-dihydroxy-2-naphthoate octaprenyltransferase [Myxococcales bacterium]|nr:1,4-dihydroxy-2-naphthoate octaprenyltransferase [Myxococcales bacterium]
MKRPTEFERRPDLPYSVITCDLEGRIETFNDDAAKIFGYSADEVVGKRRVSLFSPGEIVLGHVNGWLKAAVEHGEHCTHTTFVRRDGSRFAAQIRITPTYRSKGDEREHIGYCGVTQPLPDVSPDETMPDIGIGTRIFKWMVITRAPFLTAALVPVLIGAAWAAHSRQLAAFPWLSFVLALVGALALHVAANTFNDYFDHKSGTDDANNDYFLPFSGGSRSIELGLVTPRRLFSVAMVSLLVAAGCGAALVALSSPALLLYGLAGAFSAYFYTAPPLRLVARKGLGELLIGLNFGPLITAGTVHALTGSVRTIDFLIGLPIGLLTTAILWINEFPDATSDALTGKNHLVVQLGKKRARWGYLLLLTTAFGLVGAAIAGGTAPRLAALCALALPLAVFATAVLFRHYESRALVRANAATIQLHLVFGLALAAGLLWG